MSNKAPMSGKMKVLYTIMLIIDLCGLFLLTADILELFSFSTLIPATACIGVGVIFNSIILAKRILTWFPKLIQYFFDHPSSAKVRSSN